MRPNGYYAGACFFLSPFPILHAASHALCHSQKSPRFYFSPSSCIIHHTPSACVSIFDIPLMPHQPNLLIYIHTWHVKWQRAGFNFTPRHPIAAWVTDQKSIFKLNRCSEEMSMWASFKVSPAEDSRRRRNAKWVRARVECILGARSKKQELARFHSSQDVRAYMQSAPLARPARCLPFKRSHYQSFLGYLLQATED